ncbi:MAG: hypothetical protein KF809_06645 [Chloroflexi bacterium]|nr:hypothetical protein [Chloroflexota bacterium]
MTGPVRSRSRSLIAVVSLAAFAVSAMLPAAASASDPVLHSRSAWVVVREPSRTDEYVPASRDRGNSTGGINTVQRVDRGIWDVQLPGIPYTATVQVSAMGSKLRRCVSTSWGPGAELEVRCYDHDGDLRDTPFIVVMTGRPPETGGLPGRLAYYWADVTDADSTPWLDYQFSSKPGKITLEHRSTGRYRATIPNQGHPDVVGTFQMTWYGYDAGSCRIAGWSKGAGSQTVDVLCRDDTGARLDTEHNLLFVRKLGIAGYGSGPSAYLFASKPTRTTSYHPAKATAWSSNGKQATIKRASKGVYRVTLPGMPKGGAALVTPYGTGTEDCQIGSIRTKTTPQRIEVRCFSKTGKPADAKFLLAYTK